MKNHNPMTWNPRFSIPALTFAFLLTGAPLLNAQTDGPSKENPRRAAAVAAIRTLKEGVLLVRLPSNHRKMQELERLLDEPSLDERRRKQLRTRLESLREDTRSFARTLRDAFLERYDFSDVLFLYDTVSWQTVQRHPAGYFLDSNLQPDPTLARPHDRYLFARMGHTNPEGGQGIEALVISDAQLKDLQSPFPYYSMVNTLGAVFDTVLGSPKARRKHTFKMVARLNKQLHRFYAKAGAQ